MKISSGMNPMHIDLLQESKIKWLVGGLAALGGIVAVLVYLDQKKHNDVEKENKIIRNIAKEVIIDSAFKNQPLKKG
jgi:hypothetical protein